jgi:hypothetical protein
MKKLFTTLTLLLAAVGSARADSPLTSTNFWKAYRDIPAVRQAHDIERLDTTLANYLLSKRNSIAKKAAVINALNWNYNGLQNAMLFREVLGQKYKLAPGRVDARLTADETFCLAYLTAMDDYFHVNASLKMADRARLRNPKSFTVAIVDALIRCQSEFKTPTKLWPVISAVLDNPQLTQDMRPRAKEAIKEYMHLYAR